MKTLMAQLLLSALKAHLPPVVAKVPAEGWLCTNSVRGIVDFCERHLKGTEASDWIRVNRPASLSETAPDYEAEPVCAYAAMLLNCISASLSPGMRVVITDHGVYARAIKLLVPAQDEEVQECKN